LLNLTDSEKRQLEKLKMERKDLDKKSAYAGNSGFKSVTIAGDKMGTTYYYWGTPHEYEVLGKY
jgi:hypothetical protein